MLAELDFFHFYRRLLGLVCCVYAALRLLQALKPWIMEDQTERPMTAWLRRYIITQLMRARFRHFAWDFLQVGFLVALCAYILSLHT